MKQKFRKGNIVYKEGQPIENIYIVIKGDFKLTQQYYLDCEKNTDEEYAFGVNSELKQNKLKKKLKSKELQIVIKQKGDIFGYNEKFSEKPFREFTSTCVSRTGKLLAITEAEFSKRLSHPETLNLLGEYNDSFVKWSSNRILDLKTVEQYKNKIIFTPKSMIKIQPREVSVPKKNISKVNNASPTPKLPYILGKMMTNRNKSYVSRKTRGDDSSIMMFPTEVSIEKPGRKTKSRNTILRSIAN